MKTTRTVERPYTIVESTKCDVCGSETPGSGWGCPCYRRRDVTLSYIEGETHADWWWWKSITFDICPKCFIAKVIPYLHSLGATGTVLERKSDGTSEG